MLFSRLLADEEDADSADDVAKNRRQKQILREKDEAGNSIVIGVLGKEVEEDDGKAVGDQRSTVREGA